MTGSPDPQHLSASSTQSSQRRTIQLHYGTAPLQFGKLHLPPAIGPYPIVILIHGGFWRIPYGYTLMTSLAEDLAKRGIAAWNIEYRRIGDSDGGWPNTLLDVARATDYLQALASTYELDINRVVTLGHSAGGHLALWLAARHRIPLDSILSSTSTSHSSAPASPLLPIMGAISLAGVSDLAMAWQLNLGNGAVTELLDAGFPDAPARYAAASPAAMLPLGVPQILIHGTADDRVPFEMSQAYTAAAQAAGDDANFIKLPGADHFILINAHSDAWALTVQAVQKLIHLK
ncbi:MAG: alpha/beta hydrolase [Ktedonobacteraceae bacterium]